MAYLDEFPEYGGKGMSEAQIRALFDYYLRKWGSQDAVWKLVERSLTETTESDVMFTLGQTQGYPVGTGQLSWSEVLDHMSGTFI